jgi:hypothetical protein
MIDFGRRCINCKYFYPDNKVFGDCLNASALSEHSAGRLHKFSSCPNFDEQPQHMRPKEAQRVDFDIERKNTGWDKFAYK